MTTFEFVFALYSIVISLALTHMLAGFVALRRASRVRFYLPHLLWALAAFMAPIANWASMWEIRQIADWPAWSVIVLILTGLTQYVFCAFLTPDTAPGEEVDLEAFYEKERLRFLVVFLIFIGSAFTFNFVFGGAAFYEHWLRDQLISAPGIVAAIVSFLMRPYWLRVMGGVVMLSLMSYFLVVASRLLTS